MEKWELEVEKIRLKKNFISRLCLLPPLKWILRGIAKGILDELEETGYEIAPKKEVSNGETGKET